MNTYTHHFSFGILTLTAVRAGRDVQLVISGGDTPHIGAVALGTPRPSLADASQKSSSASVLCVSGHKEDLLARRVALTVAKELDATVCVSVGIHLNAPTPGDFEAVSSAVDTLVDQYLRNRVETD